MNRLLIACVLYLLAWPSLAHDAARANRLMIEAVKLIEASEIEPSADGKFRLLKQAHDNLVEIVDRHSSTDLAVKLATGQRVGVILLSAVRKAMAQAHVTEFERPGAPIQVWRHGTAVVAVASSPPRRGWVLMASRDGIAALRDVRMGELLSTWQHRPEMSVAMSPRGRRVLAGSRDGVVALRDVRTGRVLHAWQHEREVGAVALSGERGRALVGVGRTVHVVDTGNLTIWHS